MGEKKKGPQKGAGRRLAARLKELGQRKPPQRLIDAINRIAAKQAAMATKAEKDLDV